jgi:hypothetical protein
MMLVVSSFVTPVFSAFANDGIWANGGVYRYTLEKDEHGDDVATIVEYNGSATALVIPTTLDGYKVVGIGDCAFERRPTITSLTISEGITYLGARAFGDCDALASVSVPASLAECEADWGAGPFAECDALKQVSFAAGARAVPQYVFSGCTGIESVSVPEGCTEVGDYAFARCTALASASLPPRSPG